MPARRWTWSSLSLVITLGTLSPLGLANAAPPDVIKPSGPTSAARPAELIKREVTIYSTRGDNKLHVLDSVTLQSLAVIDIGLGAHELAISSNGRWVVGSAYGGPGPGHQPADNRIAIVDLNTLKLHRVVKLEGKRPNDLAFLPKAAGSGDFLATVEMPPALVRVDAQSGATTSLPIEHQAGHMIALSPKGDVAVVAHVFPGSLTFVNVAEWKVAGRVDKLPTGAEGIAMSPDGGRVWVASNRANAISIVNVAARVVEKKIDCPGFPFRVRFAPDGKSVAVSCAESAEVAFFNAADPAKVDRVSVAEVQAVVPLAPGAGGERVVPTSIAYSTDGESLFVICDGSKPQVVRVDVAKRTVVARVPSAGPVPDALAAGMAEMPKPG